MFPKSPFRAEYYLTPAGEKPFRKWLQDIRDGVTRKRIQLNVGRLEQGNFSGCKSVGEGVSEKTLDFGPGYRIYYGRDGERLIILLCGGDKSTQVADIEQAICFVVT